MSAPLEPGEHDDAQEVAEGEALRRGVEPRVDPESAEG